MRRIGHRRARPRGRRVIPGLRRGELTRHGYAVHESAEQRHRALEKAVAEDGALTTFRRLQVQVMLRRNARRGTPEYEARRRFEADRDWVRSRYMERWP